MLEFKVYWRDAVEDESLSSLSLNICHAWLSLIRIEGLLGPFAPSLHLEYLLFSTDLSLTNIQMFMLAIISVGITLMIV